MRVVIKKLGDEFVLYVSTEAMGDQPAGPRLCKAFYPNHPFPKRMRFSDSNDAMESAEALQAYLDKDAQRRDKKKRR